MYYVANPHRVCPWSHEWIKANLFPFLEKQLQAHVLLMVPLSFQCCQQTSLTEHSPWMLLGMQMKLLKEDKLAREVGTHRAKHETSGLTNCTCFYHSIFHCACHSHLRRCSRLMRRQFGSWKSTPFKQEHHLPLLQFPSSAT